MFQLPPLIYDRVDEILDVFKVVGGTSPYNYFKTKQRGFVPINEDMLHPSQYPWMFLEYGNTSEPQFNLTNNMDYYLTLNLVCMTLADKGKIGDLIVSEGLNTNKGILDILKDIGTVLKPYKTAGIGVVEPAGTHVIDWDYGGTRPIANMMYMTPLNLSPYIRIIQIDLVFYCRERIS